MQPDDSEEKLIRETISDIEEAIEKLSMERDMLDWEIEQKEKRAAVWKARLAGLSGKTDGKTRRRKGQNFRTIIQLLDGHTSPETGISAADIARLAQLPPSSVQAILRKASTTFCESNGVWHLKAGANGVAKEEIIAN